MVCFNVEAEANADTVIAWVGPNSDNTGRLLDVCECLSVIYPQGTRFHWSV